MNESAKNARGEKAGGMPTRTCVGCAEPDAPNAFVRVVLGPPGQDPDAAREIAVDVAGGASGRGAHVHPTRQCIAKACKVGFARSFKCKVHANPNEFGAQLVESYDRRIVGLLVAARRAGHLAIGADATIEAVLEPLQRGADETDVLVVVACDAGVVVQKTTIARAVSDGKAVVFKTKSALGALLGRDEVSVLAVKSASIAREIQEARSRSEACKPEGVPA